MGWLDLIIIILVGYFVVSRFMKFDLPDDKSGGSKPGQRPGERGDDWRQMLGKSFKKDEAEEGRQQRDEGRGGLPRIVAKPVVKLTPNLVDVTGLSGLEQVRALDESFDDEAFLDGAENAYRYFYDRWNASDEDGLANLCSPQLLNQLVSQLEGYDERGEEPRVIVNEIVRKSITSGRVNGRTAVVDVEFVVNQSVDGQDAREITTLWTFARPLNSDDPNWEVQQILELS